MKNSDVEDFETNGCEEVDTQFVYKQLAHVGKPARYKGGFKLGEGSQNYRKMSWTVAAFGKHHGVDLLRNAGGKTSFVVMPMLPKALLAFNDTLAYRNNKNLPSVALGHSGEIAGFLSCYAKEKFSEGSRFWMLSIPGSNRRCNIDELSDAIKQAFDRLEVLQDVLSEAETGWIERIYAQIESPFRSRDKTFFPHFHLILESSDNPEIEAEMRALLLGFAERFGLRWASIDLKPVSKERFPAVAFYCTKPHETAYQIAEADEPEIFRKYFDEVASHKARSCTGSFKKFRKRVRDSGLKVQTTWSSSGEPTVQLVEKTRRKRKDDEHSELSKGALSNGESQPSEAVGSEDQGEALQEASDSEADPAEANVFCGVTQPSAAPGDRLISYCVMKNFDPTQFKRKNPSKGQFAYEWANSEALAAWEENTGKEFSLKEFLEPFAEDLAKLIREQGKVHYYTITACPLVLETLEEILEERKSQHLKVVKKENPTQRSWFSPTLNSLSSVSSGFKQIVSGFSIRKLVNFLAKSLGTGFS